MSTAPPSLWSRRWQRFASASVRGFHTYATWLIGISWRRFLLLSLLLLIAASLLEEFTAAIWPWSGSKEAVVQVDPPAPPTPPTPPDAASRRSLPGIHIEKDRGEKGSVEISIDQRGVRIVRGPRAASAPGSAASAEPGASAASAPAPAASAPALAASAASAGVTVHATDSGDVSSVVIRLPSGVQSEAVRKAVREAQQAIDEAVAEARADAEEARADAEAAKADAEAAKAEARKAAKTQVKIAGKKTNPGDILPTLAMLWIVASAIVKVTYKRQVAAEAQAAQAVETAEAESLRRQVLEARMAAMQAQVEPHFLFNTLASIDHLIEVDPQRASQMQKNLIALLRASMPTMREADGGSPRDLGRELAVIRPYLEILKVRMEERLTTTVDVPDGLLSAEFPAMMVQTLVENAIKHGLEPKPEGGQLLVKAEVLHGKLAVTVADTGLGFGMAPTAGTGVGLANIRERLQLLYGGQAALTIAENPGGGTRVTVTVPYKPLEGSTA